MKIFWQLLRKCLHIKVFKDFPFPTDIQILPFKMSQKFQEEEEPKESQMDQSI